MSRRGRVGLLVNPSAGRGAGARAGARALEVLRRLGHEVSDLSGLDLHAARRAAAEQAGDLQALVVVGGDGLVHAAAAAVAGTTTALGIVPAGTGNDIARGLDLALGDPVRAAEAVSTALARGSTRSVDAVRVTSGATGGDVDWYVSILAAGVDARVNERANAMRRPRGPLRYTVAALRELAVVQPVGVRLTLDCGVVEGEVLLAAVANTRCYGGGLSIAPDADPTDGLLDVVVVEAMPAHRALTVFPRVRRRTHLALPQVRVHRSRTVRLDVTGDAQGAPRPHADGEPVGSVPLTCEAVPGALHVLV